jgi:hypothetical protein
MEVGEPQSAVSQLIQMRRFNLRPIATDVGKPHIIREYEDYIRSLICSFAISRRCFRMKWKHAARTDTQTCLQKFPACLHRVSVSIIVTLRTTPQPSYKMAAVIDVSITQNDRFAPT